MKEWEYTSIELEVQLKKELQTIVSIQSDPVLISTLNSIALKKFAKSNNFVSDLFAFQSWLYTYVLNNTDSIFAARIKNKCSVEEEEKSTRKQRIYEEALDKKLTELVMEAKD